MNRHLSFPSLNGYRPAIGYFRLENGRHSYPSFLCKFGGHSLLFCFWFSLREVVFKLVGRPMGKTAASIPRGAKQKLVYVKERKLFWFGLVWFGDFKIQFGSCYFGIPGRLSSKCFCDTSMI